MTRSALVLLLAGLVAAPSVRAEVKVVEPGTAQDRAVRIIDAPPAASEPNASPTPPPAADDAPDPGDNAAKIAIDIQQGPRLSVGTKVTFKVSSQRTGYLIIVDVDATGKLTQIFPNAISLANLAGLTDVSNLLKAGTARVVPESTAPGFEFVASEPKGVGMVVAILSDRPVHLVDLPDIPAALAGQRGALQFIRDTTRGLRILPGDGADMSERPKWSFTSKLYAIQ